MPDNLANTNGGNAGAEREQCGGQQRQQPQDGSSLFGMGNPDHSRLEVGRNRLDEFVDSKGRETAERSTGLSSVLSRPGPVNGLWDGADWISCRDNKWRLIEPGLKPLVNGAPSRVGRLRAFGNAINAEAATQFILAYLEQPDMIYLTDYNPDTLACTGVSADSGFSTFDEVRQLMGEPQMSHARMLTYPGGVCFSDFPLTYVSPLCNTAPNTVQSNE